MPGNALSSCSVAVAVFLVSFQSPFRTIDRTEPDTPAALTVVSLNLALREDVDRITSELIKLGADRSVSLILLQEVVQRERNPNVARQLAGRLGLHSTYRVAYDLDSERSVGQAVLSRFDLLNSRTLVLKQFDLRFRTRRRIAVAATVEAPLGPVHVYNVHLDTRINLPERLEQLGRVVRDIQGLDEPIIVAGDFNTTGFFWLFRTIPLPFVGRQGSGLQRFMQDHGFRSAFRSGRATHEVLGMQLDWIFVRGLQVSTGSIHRVGISDHDALKVSIERGSAVPR